MKCFDPRTRVGYPHHDNSPHPSEGCDVVHLGYCSRCGEVTDWPACTRAAEAGNALAREAILSSYLHSAVDGQAMLPSFDAIVAAQDAGFNDAMESLTEDQAEDPTGYDPAGWDEALVSAMGLKGARRFFGMTEDQEDTFRACLRAYNYGANVAMEQYFGEDSGGGE